MDNDLRNSIILDSYEREYCQREGKSFSFDIRIFKLYKHLLGNFNEYILSKQQ